jgi:hypothetical protein
MAQVELFGDSPAERLINRQNRKIRVDAPAAPKTIAFERETENVLEGDRLTLQMIPQPGSKEFNCDSPNDTSVFQRMQDRRCQFSTTQ